MASLMEKLKKGRALFAGKKPMLPEEGAEMAPMKGQPAQPMPVGKAQQTPPKGTFKTKKPVKKGK